MNLSLDYDNTYTRDPVFWDTFIESCNAHGHIVYCVTMRTPAEGVSVIEDLQSKVKEIIFTSRKNKHDVCFAKGISIDVWIDDIPFFVNHDAIA